MRARIATWRGQPLKLGDRSFDALMVLAKRAPDMISKTELADAVWPGQTVSDETVSRRISLLRKAFKALSSEVPIIKSVHGRGFLLVIPETMPTEASQIVAPRCAPTMRTRPTVWSVAAVGILAVGVLASLFLRSEDPQILIDPETGAVWMGTPTSAATPFPVRAQVDERSVLINSPVSIADLNENPVAQEVYCRLADDRSLFSSTVPPELAQYLDEAQNSRNCR
ncbi:MAG: winged helix-turn-helix domain-containing protein [Pseudomonadota bacterium]